MLGAYQYIYAINAEKENWMVKVEVIRLWSIPSLNASKAHFSLEMALMDEEVYCFIILPTFFCV